MTEPEQDPAPLSAGEGELAEALREARRFGPTDAQVASLAASLGAAMGPGGGGGGGGAGGVPAIAKWAAVAVLVGIAGSIAWIGLGSSDGSQPSVEAPPIAVAPPAAASAVAEVRTSPSTEPQEAEVVASRRADLDAPTVIARGAREARPTIARVEPTSAPATTTTAPTEPTVPEAEPTTAVSTAPPTELSLLEGAHAALRSRPEEALALADRHRALYPMGSLAQERELLAIEALARLHRRADAQRRVERFRASWPASVHEPRLSALMAD